MGGMSKKRKYGSPGSKSIVSEEKEGELVQVEGDKRNTERTVRQDKDRDTTDSGAGDTGGYRRRAGAGVRQRSSTVDLGCEDITLRDRVKQGSEDILRRMDRQDTSNEDIKRIVREGLTTLADTVEREVKGIREKLSEVVRRNVEVEVAEMKDRMDKLEERARTGEDTVTEMLRKVGERMEEYVEKETRMSHKLEKAEDRIKEMEEELRKTGQNKITERLEKVEERLKDSDEEKRQYDVTNRLDKLEERTSDTENMLAPMRQDKESREADTDKQKDLEDRVKLSEERMDRLRQDGDSIRRKESGREMRERIEEAGKNLKYFGVDLGSGCSERRELVKRTIGCLEDSVPMKDKGTFRTVINRTRVTLLGKDTEEKHYLGRLINTMPVLLECRTEEDKRVLEAILEKAGWHSSFEWPEECMEFIRETKKEIHKLGYVESSHIVKISPDFRKGRTRIKGEVKEKKGGRYRVVAFWEVPPMDRALWESEQVRPRLPGSVQVP